MKNNSSKLILLLSTFLLLCSCSNKQEDDATKEVSFNNIEFNNSFSNGAEGSYALPITNLDIEYTSNTGRIWFENGRFSETIWSYLEPQQYWIRHFSIIELTKKEYEKIEGAYIK